MDNVQENVQNMANPFPQGNFEQNLANAFLQNYPGAQNMPRPGLDSHMQAPRPHGYDAPVYNPMMKDQAAMEEYIAAMKKMAFEEPGARIVSENDPMRNTNNMAFQEPGEGERGEEDGPIVAEDNVMRYFNEGGWGKRGANEQK